MLFWLVAGALAVLSTLWIARPFLRKGAVEMNDADGAISVFRDQLDELERDRDAGLISDSEHGAARQEIEKRALTAARRLDGGFSMSHRSLPATAAVVVACSAIALGGYAFVGSPAAPDQPLAARKGDILEQQARSGDLNARIALMIERTRDNPESFEDWWTLAVSYASIGDDAAAVGAYRKAAELAPDEAGVQAAYAEAMTLANGNKVPPGARVIFETVLREMPDPRARYYVALAKAQGQNFEAALTDWAMLARDSRPDAPWMPLVRRDIANMVRFLDYDLTDYLPDASPSEIAAAGGASEDAVNITRIDEIRAQLSQDPLDHAAWIELANRLAQSGENDQAAEALTQGAAHFAAAPFVQQKFDEAARALGMDILDSGDDGVANPSQADIAAASDLSQDEQDDMIAGMVAGLAAELQENPDNPDKWIMLIRSYKVLGEAEKAEQAFSQATGIFSDASTILDRIEAETGFARAQ